MDSGGPLCHCASTPTSQGDLWTAGCIHPVVGCLHGVAVKISGWLTQSLRMGSAHLILCVCVCWCGCARTLVFDVPAHECLVCMYI